MCIDATGVKIDWDVQEAGVDVMEPTGTPLPDSVLESSAAPRWRLKAPITTPVGTGFRSVNVYLAAGSTCTPASAPASTTRACGRSSQTRRSTW